MVTRTMPRVHDVLVPELRSALPTVAVTTWIPDVDKRTYPLVNIRRIGGAAVDVARLDIASLEVVAYARGSLIVAEDLYLDARHAIWEMVQRQTVTDAGYLHSFRETVGPTNYESPFEDTWRVQGVIQLGLRPPRTEE